MGACCVLLESSVPCGPVLLSADSYTMFLGLSYQKPCHTALCSLDSPGRVLSRHCRLSCVVHVTGAGSAALLSNALAFFHPQPLFLISWSTTLSRPMQLFSAPQGWAPRRTSPRDEKGAEEPQAWVPRWWNLGLKLYSREISGLNPMEDPHILKDFSPWLLELACAMISHYLLELHPGSTCVRVDVLRSPPHV